VSFGTPLVELLGARWSLQAPVVGLAWLTDEVCAFGLGDGTVAFARAVWDGAPHVRKRQGGGAELIAATSEPPPVVRIAAHKGACLAIAAGGAGALSGGADGRLAYIDPVGVVAEVAVLPEAVVAVAARSAEEWACAAGGSVLLGREDRTVALPPPVTLLAWAPQDRLLAAGHAGGIALIRDGVPHPLAPRERPHSLVWHPEGACLAAGFAGAKPSVWHLASGEERKLAGSGDQANALAFSADGTFLAAAGGSEILCWRISRDAACMPHPTGLTGSRTIATQLAFHPRRTLIAAGYGSGTVLLCPPESHDVLLMAKAGGGSITALAFAPQGGRYLAFGTAEGMAAIIFLPDVLFRQDSGRTDEQSREALAQ
jgi:WD40 repeat protein